MICDLSCSKILSLDDINRGLSYVIEIRNKLSDIFPSDITFVHIELVLDVEQDLLEPVGSLNGRKLQDLILKEVLEWEAHL